MVAVPPDDPSLPRSTAATQGTVKPTIRFDKKARGGKEERRKKKKNKKEDVHLVSSSVVAESAYMITDVPAQDATGSDGASEFEVFLSSVCRGCAVIDTG